MVRTIGILSCLFFISLVNAENVNQGKSNTLKEECMKGVFDPSVHIMEVLAKYNQSLQNSLDKEASTLLAKLNQYIPTDAEKTKIKNCVDERNKKCVTICTDTIAKIQQLDKEINALITSCKGCQKGESFSSTKYLFNFCNTFNCKTRGIQFKGKREKDGGSKEKDSDSKEKDGGSKESVKNQAKTGKLGKSKSKIDKDSNESANSKKDDNKSKTDVSEKKMGQKRIVDAISKLVKPDNKGIAQGKRTRRENTIRFNNGNIRRIKNHNQENLRMNLQHPVCQKLEYEFKKIYDPKKQTCSAGFNESMCTKYQENVEAIGKLIPDILTSIGNCIDGITKEIDASNSAKDLTTSACK